MGLSLSYDRIISCLTSVWFSQEQEDEHQKQLVEYRVILKPRIRTSQPRLQGVMSAANICNPQTRPGLILVAHVSDHIHIICLLAEVEVMESLQPTTTLDV